MFFEILPNSCPPEMTQIDARLVLQFFMRHFLKLAFVDRQESCDDAGPSVTVRPLR
jgi:hypothetical protein